MTQTSPHNLTQPIAMRAVLANRVLVVVSCVVLVALVGVSAILAKEASVGNLDLPMLARVEHARADAAANTGAVRTVAMVAEPATTAIGQHEPATRWFDGRPVRVARTIKMKVTGYSPDGRSCGKFADGKTATLHSVWTNGMKLVAADPRVLGYGTMLSIPGYASDSVVPVLDCGGAIKGNRLDLLFPTHGAARRWGVRTVEVQVWEYADGLAAPNPREVR